MRSGCKKHSRNSKEVQRLQSIRRDATRHGETRGFLLSKNIKLGIKSKISQKSKFSVKLHTFCYPSFNFKSPAAHQATRRSFLDVQGSRYLHNYNIDVGTLVVIIDHKDHPMIQSVLDQDNSIVWGQSVTSVVSSAPISLPETDRQESPRFVNHSLI